MAGRKLVHRRRVLLEPEQRPEEDAGKAPPVALLIAFTRRLIHVSPSGDRLKLAMYGARADVNATDEEVDAFWAAVLGEMEQSPWPKGFF